ncbi:unnamed protein product [Trichogramma brassicae]|uniref:Uncharacterized protein n=1 Tax=Trichogramma brassicae TaxID=86971 RepID=A0A6H5IPQ0_9HYME|nr:unnamed protein product [Trichogramma brassicae]
MFNLSTLTASSTYRGTRSSQTLINRSKTRSGSSFISAYKHQVKETWSRVGRRQTTNIACCHVNSLLILMAQISIQMHGRLQQSTGVTAERKCGLRSQHVYKLREYSALSTFWQLSQRGRGD